MILDPTNQFIHHITRHCDLDGMTVLEIGCGRGRITTDLARHARRLVATDPDAAALAAARIAITAPHVEFICTGGECLDFPPAGFDLVFYSLSLHHIPAAAMADSLQRASVLLKDGGRIVVVEPGDEGSLIEAEQRFGVGCGDERSAKAAAHKALHGLSGWHVSEPVCFETLFHFDDEEDFLANLLPDFQSKSGEWRQEVSHLLAGHRVENRISLYAERRMFILDRNHEIVR